jgi:cold shock CspA family protein
MRAALVGLMDSTGRVVQWPAGRDRNYGFVAVRGYKQAAFLHLSDLEGMRSDERPQIGDVVEFELIETERGPRAVKARIVKRAETSDEREESVDA